MQPEEQGEKTNKNEQNIRETWNIVKCTNVCAMGVPEGEVKKEQKKH